MRRYLLFLFLLFIFSLFIHCYLTLQDSSLGARWQIEIFFGGKYLFETPLFQRMRAVEFFLVVSPPNANNNWTRFQYLADSGTGWEFICMCWMQEAAV